MGKEFSSRNEESPATKKFLDGIRLDEIQSAIQKDHEKYGTQRNPTKDGLLAIAELGANHWNAWRRRFPKFSIDFSDFTFEKPIDFSFFDFSNLEVNSEQSQPCANFTNAIFLYPVCFDDCIFGERAEFVETTFKSSCHFNRCKFGLSSGFDGSRFGGYTSFDRAEFESNFSFSEIIAEDFFICTDAKFSDDTNFNKSIFNDMADFEGAFFDGYTNFEMAKFKTRVNFSIKSSAETDQKNKAFGQISFSGAEFYYSHFTGRIFNSSTSFGSYQRPNDENITKNTVFYRAPEFHNCKFHQDTSFDGAEFKQDFGADAARAYRTLKLAMEQLKATREEQKFFRLEMKAEHPSLPRGKRWMSTLYSLFSDYGFSLWRPAAWLLALSLAFGTGYGALANACAGNTGCIDIKAATDADAVSGPDRTSAVIKYTLGSVSPVPGLDKMQTELRAPLFGHQGWISIAALALEILHKITTLVMTFLFALALRNLFKMKS